MTTTQRLSIRDVAPNAYTAVGALSVFVRKGPLDEGLCALIDIRASQLNHCAWCLDMHAAEARKAGISQRQIDLVAAWHGPARCSTLESRPRWPSPRR
jgi:AhpD family alkylhydroperoxidase